MKTTQLFLWLAIGAFLAVSCGKNDIDKSSRSVVHPKWSQNKNIYEVNIRQYTPEGNFAAFEKHIPRLKEMGVDILWLMPINPISEKNRKGSMGSYYASKDYYGINPEFGTLDDFKKLVETIHKNDMYVIVDWVANHTGWDNKLIDEHPGWYTKDSAGNIVPPVADWTDVADLNYDNPDLRKYMVDVLKYWITECKIDGYRCDVAGMVPISFWDSARMELDKVKPVFMLAEWESPELHPHAFDMGYGWEFHHIMNQIAKGAKNVREMEAYFVKRDTTYAKDDIAMYFTSNHDENSWNGTEYERMGEGAQTFALISYMVPGMPLLYSGQEEPLYKKLRFFDKDTIPFSNYRLGAFYTWLNKLKHQKEALWHGEKGGSMRLLKSANDTAVFCFAREKENEKIVVIANLSGKEQETKLKGNEWTGTYTNLFDQSEVQLSQNEILTLEAWGYLVLEKK